VAALNRQVIRFSHMERICRRTLLRRLAAGLPASLAMPSLAGAATIREISRGGMIYRRLGGTGIDVSLLGFGSHTDPRYKRKIEHGNVLVEEGQRQRDRLIARALDRGVNLVDTYESEGQWEPMARLVRERRQKVLVSLCRQFPMFVGDNIDRACKLFGHVDLYRIYVDGRKTLDAKNLADWDVLRRARESGKVRAIGISTHDESIMLAALEQFEGIDYFMFPYNFIHARADYLEFLPKAAARGVGLIAIKPLAAGSIVKLDPNAPQGTRPERDFVQLYHTTYRPLLPSVVAEITRSLDRMPGETLCQAALRFVYSRPFMTCAMPGMFEESTLEDNYAGLVRHRELSRDERAALDAAARLAALRGKGWLPRHYQWLDQRWRS
jgi:aryl-alcohol dehydrogenase-like predicted oxidoreductase